MAGSKGYTSPYWGYEPLNKKNTSSGVLRLGAKDSNLYKQIQSLLSCH